MADLELPRTTKPVNHRPRALVIDDDPVSQLTLRKLLSDYGYDVDVSHNGAQGFERFSAARPDIVFMDLLMPIMDGIAATQRIKQLCGDDFVPVIFLTGGPDDDDDLVGCINAGGDDFLSKPYRASVLVAKIRAMERIRELHQSTRALHARMEEEQYLVKGILECAVMGPNVRSASISVHLAPATTFNGDLLLTAYTPAGDLYALLGDFAGHGLAASFGALPVAETFRAMTARGFGPTQVLDEINRKLRLILPTGKFLAAVFLRVKRSLAHVSVINCGMPDAWLIRDGVVAASFTSNALPLAVTASFDFDAAHMTVPAMAGDRVLLMSDGVIEAANRSGEMLGAERLRAAVQSESGRRAPLVAAVQAIEQFCAGIPLADDASLAVVHLVEALFAATH